MFRIICELKIPLLCIEMTLSNFLQDFLAKVRKVTAVVMGRRKWPKMCFFLKEQDTSKFEMKFLGLVEI